MAINELPKTGPFSNIRQWLYEKTKVFTPNPMKPFEKGATKKQITNSNKLAKLLTESHGPTGRINKLITAVNDLLRRVTTNETDIAVLQKRMDNVENQQKLKSKKGHTHQFIGQGSIFPSTQKKGGKIEELEEVKKDLIRKKPLK